MGGFFKGPKGEEMSKRKGTRIEYKVQELLEAVGFKCVRSAGSHGPFDIAAFHTSMNMLVQVKSNRRPSPDEIDEMRTWNVPDNTVRAYAVWKDREKYPVFYFEKDW